MERVLTGEFSRFLIILGIGVFSLSALLYRGLAKVKENFTAYQKPTAWYLLLSTAFFAVAAGAECMLAKTVTYLGQFIILQIYFLVLGILHVRLMHQYLKWSDDTKLFWLEALFTIILSMVGGMAFVIILRHFGGQGFELLFAGSISLFLVPLLVYETFTRAMSIPAATFNRWVYPIHGPIILPPERDLKNLLIIHFVFRKQDQDTHFTCFRSRAPIDMEFGLLFYFFINDYNIRNPDNKIAITDESGAPYGWSFCKKPRWYTIKKRQIDFGHTIYSNRIKENAVIICDKSLT